MSLKGLIKDILDKIHRYHHDDTAKFTNGSNETLA